MPRFRHLALVGPTGSGKSALAMEIARRNAAFEIVSVDAMCVYRGMDIGTAKPSPEDRAEVAHHLIDIVEPSDDYTLSRFQDDCAAAVRDIEARGMRALFVGGTGLYMRAAIDGLNVPPQYPEVRARLEAEPDTVALYELLQAADPDAAVKIERLNRRRIVRALEVVQGSGQLFSRYGPGLDSYPATSVRQVGLWPSRPDSGRRIRARVEAMVAAGLVEEVRDLGPRMSRTARQAIGYRQLLMHLEGTWSLEQVIEAAVSATVQFARRQRVWFRRDPCIAWMPADIDPATLVGTADW